jgi:hypothetical protein
MQFPLQCYNLQHCIWLATDFGCEEMITAEVAVLCLINQQSPNATTSIQQIKAVLLTITLLGFREHIYQCRGLANAQRAQQARRHRPGPGGEEGEHQFHNTQPTGFKLFVAYWWHLENSSVANNHTALPVRGARNAQHQNVC